MQTTVRGGSEETEREAKGRRREDRERKIREKTEKFEAKQERQTNHFKRFSPALQHGLRILPKLDISKDTTID